MKVTIELPESYVVTSRGVECAIEAKSIKVDWAELALHGLTQKVADAASGAQKLVTDDTTVEDATESLMAKARDALYAGEWTRRGTGTGGVSEETLVQRMVMRQVFKAKVGAKSPEFAKFTGLEPAEQNEQLDALFAKNEAVLSDAVAKKLAERKAARESKAGLVKAVSIEL